MKTILIILLALNTLPDLLFAPKKSLIGIWTSKSDNNKWRPNMHPSEFSYDTLKMENDGEFVWKRYPKGISPSWTAGKYCVSSDTLTLIANKGNDLIIQNGQGKLLSKKYSPTSVSKLLIVIDSDSEIFLDLVNGQERFEKLVK